MFGSNAHLTGESFALTGAQRIIMDVETGLRAAATFPLQVPIAHHTEADVAEACRRFGQDYRVSIQSRRPRRGRYPRGARLVLSQG